ncbi:MAG: DUF1343 domain-containing protein [Bacteroidales bacterium]|nr:DUF1343 domain-containing protein [Bacteroidales bacterium]
MKSIFLILTAVLFFSSVQAVEFEKVTVAAERMDQYLPKLNGKKVAIIANHTALVGKTHLVDTLLSRGVGIVKIFAPEHGFRGLEDAGASVENQTDTKTGLPIISLYGNNKKPSQDQLKDIDVVVFDIQDVGVRFFTYISTMHLAMEACAENNVKFMVLDRPNPNGYFVDGPILQPEFKSFIGMHPIPIVHGLTVGELALMINGEHWLKDNSVCDLEVITCENYTHKTMYELPVKPSPNLPNMTAVLYYPTVGLLEGTSMSVGRGTEKPFQYVGHPELSDGYIEFTPKSMLGAKHPKWENQQCKGYDVNDNGIDYIVAKKGIGIACLLKAYANVPKDDFFKSSFNKLAGNKEFQMQIEFLEHEDKIRESWAKGLEAYKSLRKKYLLYEDFE